MKKLLIDKLIEIGYASQWAEQKINDWEFFNIFSSLETEEKQEIELYIYNRPTQEIPRIFLNVDKRLKSVFVLEGIIELQNKEFLIAGSLTLADYDLDKTLCLVCITETNKIKILKYVPIGISENIYGKTYEQNITNERENTINDYFAALTENSKLTKEKAKEVLHVLAQEYIIDKIITENLNPRIKIYDDAKKFADNITSYNYKYINREKNTVKEIKKEIQVKILGCGVQTGMLSNNPYLTLDEVNQTANFYLDKPSFVWLSSNLKRKEELAIYSASAMYSAKTYNEWLESRDDIQLIEKAEKLALSFSRQVCYTVSKNSILDVLKKLNRELIVSPIDFIKNNISEGNEEIDTISYHFSIINDPSEFEKELYVKIEDYFAGAYRYQMVDTLKDNYTLVGKNINYTDINGNVIQEQSIANFNVNINTAILKKVVLVTSESLYNIQSNNLDMLPIPTIEVVFYLPSIQENNGLRPSDNVNFYREIDNAELEKRMEKVTVSYVTREGTVLKNQEEIPAWINENFTPEIDYKITDQNGLMWEYAEMEVPTILVKENEKNEVTLVYDKLKRKVKINFVDEAGNQIKEPQEAIYQVGEKIKFEEELRYIDPFGGLWKAKTLDKLNQKVFEEEAKNVINMIYEEETVEIILSFVDEFGQKVMGDKVEKVQIGSRFKYNIAKEIIDGTGKYWSCTETPEEFEVKEGEFYKISLKCKPLMTSVSVQYINEEEIEVLPSIQEEVQIGTTYIPKMVHTWQSEDGRSWVIASNQLKEFKIKKTEEENVIKVKYEPVLVKATIQYLNVDGQEIKRKEMIPAQLGSKWVLNPKTLIKDEKGNEWQIVDKGYKPIVIKENEKENIITFVYQVAKANVTITCITLEGTMLKPEEQFIKQIGSAFVPTPEQYITDKENKRWKLRKIQPAMLKIKSTDNKITVTYQPDNVNVVWQYLDTEGNQLKDNEMHLVQVGEKYTPIVTETTIQRGGNNLKLLNIEPYEITVSENQDENIVRLIYVKTTE